MISDERTERRRLLVEFLEDRHLMVLDVVAGAAPGTRRLYVGEREDSRIRYAISMPLSADADAAVLRESRLLSFLETRLTSDLATTVPTEVEELTGLASATALVVTPVPGLGSSPATDRRGSMLDGVVTWLAALWRQTAAAPIQVQLGHEPVEKLLRRSRNVAQLGPATEPLLRARRRLAEIQVSSTASHGCLCTRHVHGEGSAVSGVDDWGHGGIGADPLRDLGRFAVDVVAGHLPEVVSTRSQRAREVRRALARGLEELSAPPKLWRDVLLLAQLEAATERLDRGDELGMDLLGSTIQALPARS
jgi:hypothetical protein